MIKTEQNVDRLTVAGFGDEWERFDQTSLSSVEHLRIFEQYFSVFPWESLPDNPIGFDMGCGSGRWAKLVAPRVEQLHCIDPSVALHVARRALSEFKNCVFHSAGVGDEVLPPSSMDFGYALGVLHHVPDTAAGIKSCVALLKPGAPFLLYIYYAFDNRPPWFRLLWRGSNLIRKIVCRLPNGVRYMVSQVLAAFLYWPLARSANLLAQCGLSSAKLNLMPLSSYRDKSFYTMRTDALDRFGTRLEQRFTREEIRKMMEDANLDNIRFSESVPFWCAVGTRAV